MDYVQDLLTAGGRINLIERPVERNEIGQTATALPTSSCVCTAVDSDPVLGSARGTEAGGGRCPGDFEIAFRRYSLQPADRLEPCP